MGLPTLLFVFVALQMAPRALGKTTYRQYKILTGDGSYYYDYYNPDRSYYVNPYTSYPYRYISRPIASSDDKVYITDMYGRTTSIVDSSAYHRYGYGRGFRFLYILEKNNEHIFQILIFAK